MGKPYTQPEHDDYCDGSTTYNYNAVKKCAGGNGSSENLETDYSIKGKDMSGKPMAFGDRAQTPRENPVATKFKYAGGK